MHQPPPVPTSVRVLGIMNIVFAGLGVFGALISYAMYWGSTKVSGHNPVVDVARANPKFMSYLATSLVLGLFASVALLLAGIGMLKLRSWARKLAIGYALYAIVAGIVGIVVTYKMVIGPMLDATASSSVERAGAAGGAFGGIVGGIIGVAYPVVLLVFMRRKNVVEAFERAAPPRMPEARVVR